MQETEETKLVSVDDIKNAFARIDELQIIRKEKTKPLLEAISKIDEEFYDGIRTSNSTLEAGKSRFYKFALKIAYKNSFSIPYDRDGSRCAPDSIRWTTDGVSMRWDADHPNDIRDANVTWEQIAQAVESKTFTFNPDYDYGCDGLDEEEDDDE